MEHWYLLRTKPRQEAVAKENLRRQNFRAFLPLYRCSRRKQGRWTEVAEPMFPGYLFIPLDLLLQNCDPIRSTRGVSGFVRFGLEPAPVPDAVVEELIAAEAVRNRQIPPLFKPGDAVAIVAGGFSGLKAIFQAEKGADRVILLLDLLGRSSRITLHRDAVVPGP
jgi:transcriptional antiterminator RfaH